MQRSDGDILDSVCFAAPTHRMTALSGDANGIGLPLQTPPFIVY